MDAKVDVSVYISHISYSSISCGTQSMFFFCKKTLIVPETIPFSSSPKTAVLPFKAIFLLLKKSMGDRYSVG